jgi:hypothetical protein
MERWLPMKRVRSEACPIFQSRKNWTGSPRSWRSPEVPLPRSQCPALNYVAASDGLASNDEPFLSMFRPASSIGLPNLTAWHPGGISSPQCGALRKLARRSLQNAYFGLVR